MFLKRIVLHGFKSFADRTEFEFGAGITCVVGPNGCGKSNILDAVRWVLGEQSARSLRGGKMSDVIFNGSRSRKPAGAAEVQLTFDNRAGILHSDAQEVTVSRTLYRSGESEYRINGKICRLKDIRDLLLDTGVGVDAYSVIEQGRVDLLLQASPLDRREIFEEAAGISRYKVRRIEAQRKLERTQNNLLRLHDVVEELEKRLRSVRLAAGKARNWQQYDARLRELRSTWSMAEFHDLEQARRRVQAQIDALLASLQEHRAQLAARDVELAEIEHLRQSLDERIQAEDADLLTLQTGLSARAERIALGEQRLPELAELCERRRQQAADLAERADSHQQRIAAAEAALAELRTAEDLAEQRISETQAARSAAEAACAGAREALERERVATYEAARQGALLRNEQENRAQQRGRLTAQADRLAARQQEIEREQADLTARAAESDGRIAQLDARASELADASRECDRTIAGLNDQTEHLDAEIGTAKEARSALLARLTLLEGMEQRLEGVDQGTRAVLAWRDAPPADSAPPSDNIVGLVADLLRIDDPRVALLQHVLAACETHVVVRDTAAFVAELVRRSGCAGPLRVLGLDRLPRTEAPISYAHVPGYVARATDWVACDPLHRPLAEHLLGRTFIVETLDAALRLAADALTGCTFVTLAGETVAADGRIAFGAAGPAGGLISRKAEIRQLRLELEEVEDRLVQLTRRRLQVEQAASDAQLQKTSLLQRIATAQREHADARNERARLEDARLRLEREGRLLADELAGLRRGLAELADQLASLATESAAVDAAHHSHEARMAELAAALAARDAAIARLVEDFTAAKEARGRAAEKRAAAEQARAALGEQQAQLRRAREQAEREAAETAGQIEQAGQELARLRDEQATDTAACEQRRAALLALRDERQRLRQRAEECSAAGRTLQRRIEEVEAELHARQVALREAEVRAETLVARVRDELGLDLAARYAGYQHAEQDWAAIKAEIEELKGKIARLGHVNLDALAELEELTPRYDHLVAQRDDLTDASTRLQALIEELDRESRTRFAAAFEQIRVQFQEMFRKLFGGGKADIVLEDPEHALECGIDIIARPPGKEPQSISLLSGGEKTLTAVALLMAVFRSRPSPFAILDEVDAALDESNVERFNSVVQDFLALTQFVIITHSKRTMASADILYGVTMEEPGVSKRVSVRFEERVPAPDVA
ncbi:MAG: chromosome segregation protein SMC [Planctomycetota bacterium]